MLDDYLDRNFQRMVDTVSELITYNSVSDETSQDPNHPFGPICSDVLNRFLSIANNMGFKTKNIDNYCGYVEFGEGEELVGIVGHLDIVPADINDGWSSDPFKADIRAGKLFGRGSIDDKGPVVAALFAMKALMDNNIELNKRVRLIVGLNEEKSWKCINKYKEVEEFPTIGFSPDANFPGIYAEKGIMSVGLTHKFIIPGYKILNIDTHENAINVVPKFAEITLQKIDSNAKDLKNEINPLLNDTANITIEEIDENVYKITSIGKASHASRPEEGINAITNLVKYIIDNTIPSDNPEFNFLNKLYELGFFDIESPEFLSRKEIEYATEFDDESIIQDESGILTSNVARMSYNTENESIHLETNLRVPVTYSLDDIYLKYRQLIKFFEEIEVKNIGMQDPLYIEKDNYLVKTLVDIFNKNTESNLEPIAIGGGTYARAFKNMISYGVTMPGEKDMCHQVDEYIKLDDLKLASIIYTEAIYELAK